MANSLSNVLDFYRGTRQGTIKLSTAKAAMQFFDDKFGNGDGLISAREAKSARNYAKQKGHEGLYNFFGRLANSMNSSDVDVRNVVDPNGSGRISFIGRNSELAGIAAMDGDPKRISDIDFLPRYDVASSGAGD